MRPSTPSPASALASGTPLAPRSRPGPCSPKPSCSVVLASHPPQFLAFGEGHLQPAVAAGNGAFDRYFSGHFPNIPTTDQGGGFAYARRVVSLIYFCPQGHLALPHDRRVRNAGPGQTHPAVVAGNSPVYSQGCKPSLPVAEGAAGNPSCRTFGRILYFRYSSQE